MNVVRPKFGEKRPDWLGDCIMGAAGRPLPVLANALIGLRAEVPDALSELPAGDGTVSEIGAELFALVGRARAAGLDPELELRSAARAYRDRVLAWEAERRHPAGPQPG